MTLLHVNSITLNSVFISVNSLCLVTSVNVLSLRPPTPNLSVFHFLPENGIQSASTGLKVSRSLPPTMTLFSLSDRATKMVHLIATSKSSTSLQTAHLFISNVVRLHGLPRSIHSDRDRRFMSHFWISLCEILDIKQCASSAYHPQSNGQAERINQTVEQCNVERCCNWVLRERWWW